MRVGALILVAVGLIAVFVMLMTGITFQPTNTVYVSFHNPGGLTTGAPVRISGVKVGRVSDIEFLGALDRRPGPAPDALIRVVAKIETALRGGHPRRRALVRHGPGRPRRAVPRRRSRVRPSARCSGTARRSTA